MKLYEQMARTAIAWRNCIKTNNEEWKQKHNDTMKKLLDRLPHGSGINGAWWIDIEDCSDQKLVFGCWFQHMNENGMYDGGTDFTVTVKPSLTFGFNVRITGKFPSKYNDTREYLLDVLHDSLKEEID